jgi:serine/threonine-protein kinase
MADDRTNPPAHSSAPPTQVTQSPRPITAVTAGTRIIGTYEIEKLINTGGMGEVYRGRNIHNGEAVAIKIVLPHLANDEMIVQLFQKEAKVLGRLFHEAIVRYHVFTNDPEIGRPCIVMEFVEGTSLNDVIKRGPMPVADVKVLLRRLSDGLHKAHTVGVVHRDLSPDNVILEDGQVQHAKIIDFGIAKSSMKGDATLLQGQFAGKFSYVAPEQLGAYGGGVDARTDVYSLALIMVAVCQGRVLNMGKSIIEAVRARNNIPDLSNVYPEIRPLLEHMLEPNPEDRPASMAEVIRLVEHPEQVPARAVHEDEDRTRIISALPPVDVQAGSRTGVGGTAAGRAPASQPQDKSGVDELFLGIPDKKPAAPAPAPAKSSGKGGLIAILLVLAVAGGGAGAWMSGMFDPKAPPPVDPGSNTAAGGTEVPGGGTAAPAGTETTTGGTGAPAGGAGTDTAGTGAGGATTGGAGTETAGTGTAGSGTAGTETAGSGTTGTETAGTGTAGTETASSGTAGTGTAETGGGTAAPGGTGAAEAPLPADPRQARLAWLAGFDPGPCAHVEALPGEGETFPMQGFAETEAPFGALVAQYKAQFGAEPDLSAFAVTKAQCPVVDFVAGLPEARALPPPRLILDNPTGTLRIGEPIAGRIEGLAGRAVTLFAVNAEGGGSVNLKDFLSRASDGTVSFSFGGSLPDGVNELSQLLFAVVTEQPVTTLDAVPVGVTARALVPFMQNVIKKAGQDPSAALAFFRLVR